MQFLKINKIFNPFLIKLIKFHYYTLNLILRQIQKLLFNNSNTKNVKRVLVYRIGAFGDSITALPAITEIRKKYSESKIDLITSAKITNPVSMDKIISPKIFDNIINYSNISFKELYRLLSSKKYDLFIELPNNLSTLRRALRNMVFVKFLGIKSAFGWQISHSKIFSKLQEKHIIFDNEAIRLLKILNIVNYDINNLSYPLNITEENKEKIRYELEKIGGLNRDKNIAIIVGSKRSQNRWPIEYFDQIIRELNKLEFNIFLLGGDEDLVITNNLTTKDLRNVYNYCGILTPMESGALLTNCSLTLSNDTGPMHLAYAVGSQVIAIFSSRDYPNKWYPPNNNCYVLRNSSINCRACFSETCNNNLCMKEITPNLVLNKIKSVKSIIE